MLVVNDAAAPSIIVHAKDDQQMDAGPAVVFNKDLERLATAVHCAHIYK